ncbi:hypothetical protein CDD81_5304 [Ophiocordyceps australis]|uniref:Uncharacterized protein n=1 Tax=Ophiocordyceps australis TaxID=1399860 RepID=A0A2C5YI31_9HYPO|nr:hypothetical protein CDD81_5304 [Ophiocordyceps australis]
MLSLVWAIQPSVPASALLSCSPDRQSEATAVGLSGLVDAAPSPALPAHSSAATPAASSAGHSLILPHPQASPVLQAPPTTTSTTTNPGSNSFAPANRASSMHTTDRWILRMYYCLRYMVKASS